MEEDFYFRQAQDPAPRASPSMNLDSMQWYERMAAQLMGKPPTRLPSGS